MLKVQDIVKTSPHGPISIRPDAPLTEAAGTLQRARIGALVVMDEDKNMRGILTERDILRGFATHGAELGDMTVEEIMSLDVVTCSPQDELQNVMQEMMAGWFRHMPVVEDDDVVGIVSIRDVMLNQLNALREEAEQLRAQV